MLFYFGCAVCAFLAFLLTAVIFVFTIKSRKPHKKIKMVAASISLAITVILCALAFHNLFIPEVYINTGTLYFNGHHYKDEGQANFDTLPNSNKVVAYHIYNINEGLNNKIIGYFSADLIYKIDNTDDVLYIPVEMAGISCYKRID